MSGNVESVKAAELTSSELEVVSGGLSFNYSAIKWTYVEQRAEGAEPPPKPGR